MPHHRLRMLSGAAAALAVVVSALAGAGAVAGAAGVVPRARAGLPGAARLSAVSCAGPSWCMAVGSYVGPSSVQHALALVWNGRAWRELRNPPGGVLGSVSCSSDSFCMARRRLDGQTYAWDGRTWRAVTNPKHARHRALVRKPVTLHADQRPRR